MYCPLGVRWRVSALETLELAVCSAPARVGKLPLIMAPGDVPLMRRGEGTNTRFVADLLPDTQDFADRLLVVEAITPAGHWSSYPPHKHDVDDLPHESALEEIYYHRTMPPGGFAMQRIYTNDRSIDQTITVHDGEITLVPRGYHPVAAAHGYDLYYLNVMAGPKRV